MTDSNKEFIAHKHFTMGEGVYRFVGIWSAPSSSVLEQNPSGYNSMMANRPKCCNSTCAHCGTGIVHHCIIADSNGKEFAVGTSCIEKLHDTELTTAVKQAIKKRDKALREQKREEERQKKWQDYQDELEAQRERNGGLTDEEIQKKMIKDAEENAMFDRQEAGEDVLRILRATSGEFADSMHENLLDGRMPQRGARTIVIEIMAKRHGRKNSKAYKAAYPQCESDYVAMEVAFKEIEDKLTAQLQGESK